MQYGHLGKHARTDCTVLYGLYGFVQQPSSKFVPKNCLKICDEAVVLFLDFCAEKLIALLDFCAQISASNFVLNVAALFLDFRASLSWKQCLSYCTDLYLGICANKCCYIFC